jgi:glycerate 2-kinase
VLGAPSGERRPRAGWLLAPDKFKGTHTAREVALALADGIGSAGGAGELDVCPLADGGDGTLDTLLDALGGRRLSCAARDPLGRRITAAIGLLGDGQRAIVEVANVSGLALLEPAERDAEAASTAGTGELIAAAVAHGARSVLVAAGGSATTDGGSGAISAIDAVGGIAGVELTVLADVSIPFERAAEVFGPQKGADRAAVERLRSRLEQLAASMPRDPRGVPMSGAAGGLAGGLWAQYGATIVSGADWVLDAVGFDARLAGARGVITGEGRLDATTLHGKAVFEVAARCAGAGIPAHAVVGCSTLIRGETEQIGLSSVREAGTLAEIERAARSIAVAAGEQ